MAYNNVDHNWAHLPAIMVAKTASIVVKGQPKIQIDLLHLLNQYCKQVLALLDQNIVLLLQIWDVKN